MTTDQERDESVADRASRRRVLQGVGATGVAGVLAGCLGGDDDDDENGDDANGDDANGDDDEPEPASFDVTDLEVAEESVTRGDSVSVEATIENTGEDSGEQTVEFHVDGDVEGEQDLELDGGEEDTVSFDAGTEDLTPDEYDYGVFTDDDDEMGAFTVEPVIGDDPHPLLSFDDDPVQVVVGENTVEATIDSPYNVAIDSGTVELSVPDGWSVEDEDGADLDGFIGSQDASWEVDVSDDAEEEAELTADVSYSIFDEDADVSVTVDASVVEPLSAPWGLNNGGEGEDGDTDEEEGVYGPVEVDGLTFDEHIPEQVTASGDLNVAVRDEQEVGNTEHDELYLTEHWGGDIGFDIPFENGQYNVTLHFAETWHGEDGGSGEGGEGDRVFDVTINGEEVLSEFDPYAEADGAFIATPQTFPIEVTDNVISIETESIEDSTAFKAIEVREFGGFETPFGYNASGGTVDDMEADGATFTSESPFIGIEGDVDGGNWIDDVEGTEYDDLYGSEEHGVEESDIEYTFPLENGTYDVTLYFGESFHGEEDVGERVTNISLNDELVMEEFDIVEAVGPATAYDETHTVEVNDGELVVLLESVEDWPKISGIKIEQAE
ncbi:malectin domain-containing carbohydrate-binding protein [Halobacteria archaeon AArc-dxtr1]|nr:malectin domain-containing carbohydrate-binding protein [Halobacteria archaeon AArc-dxtr1]